MNRSASRPRVWLAPTLLGVIFLLLAGWYVSFDVVYAGRMMPGAQLGVTDFSGLTFAAADEKVGEMLAEVNRRWITLTYQQGQYRYTLDQLGVELEREDAMAQLSQFGRSPNLLTNVRERFGGVLGLVSPSAPCRFTPAFATVAANLAKKYQQVAAEASVEIKGQRAVAHAAQPGRELRVDQLKALISQQLGRLQFDPIVLPVTDSAPNISTEIATATAQNINRTLTGPYTLTARQWSFTILASQLWQWLEISPQQQSLVARLKPIELEKFLKSLEPEVNQPMQNAVLKLSGQKVIAFQPDRPGAVLRTKDAAALIQQNFLGEQRELELPVNYLEPTVRLSELNDLGIDELVASGVSNFAGSPANRRHNIKNGAAKFNNVTIAPAEAFSFNKTLGVVDETTGYLPELVIKGDETTPEFGGGLCQVSTTAFRAILNGGYPITERRNHSYRVVYYEPAGSDATIYPPSPDLRFVNDSPGHILMQTYIEGNNLYFDFYGTKMNRTVKLEGPKIFNITEPPEPVYIETSTIPEGTTQKIDTAHRGADTILYRHIYDATGREVRKEEFKSHYVPWPAKFLVGVKEAPKVATDLKNVPPASSSSEQAPVELTPPSGPEAL